MKTFSPVLCALIATGLLVGCRHPQLPPQADSGVLGADGGVLLPPGYHNPPGLVPEVGLGINGVTEAEVLVGSPVIIDISVKHPSAADARLNGTTVSPILIAAQMGTWGKFVTLVVTDSNGAVQAWPVHLVTPPTASLAIDAQTAGHLTLTLAPGDSSSLLPGLYALDVWLDTREGSTTASWQGVSHRGGSVRVSPLPSPLTPDWQCEQAVELARYYGDIQNNKALAAATLDAVIAAQPDAVLCLARRGAVAEGTGDVCSAWKFYRRARDAAYTQQPPAGAGPQEDSLLEWKVAQTMRQLPDAGCP